MNPVDLGTTVPALLALPIGFLTARWARRGGGRAAAAVLDAGLRPTRAAVGAARVQEPTVPDLRRPGTPTDPATAFLRAADALAATVRGLPEVEHDRRGARLARHALAVETGYGPLERSATPLLRSRARALLGHCRELERVALDRAVLRSAVRALEQGWCDVNAELCDHPHHIAASLARDVVVEWSGKDEAQRGRDRDLLEHCLRESRCLSGEEGARLLALADRLPAGWSQLIGGYFRDPLMERFAELRAPFVEAARCTEVPVGSALGEDLP
ncbi:hypothetical protein AB0O91_37545 [Kitasatospora sp. NPDC089797]|uniref:hypothetical protein n=1 Tax=Kitasatospora sp. NPDC089797 TaxID=3155298 RepID=UPI003444BD65